MSLLAKSANSTLPDLKYYPLIKIPVIVNGTRILGAVDSGATLTLINSDTAVKLDLPRVSVEGPFVKIISGTVEKLREVTDLCIEYKQTKLTLKAFIINNLPVDLLLGLNWLYSSKVTLDFSKDGEVRIPQENLLREAFGLLVDMINEQFYPRDNTAIYAHNYQVVCIQSNESLCGSYTLVPTVNQTHGIKIPPCMAFLVHGKGYIIIKNYTNHTILLNKTTALGIVEIPDSDLSPTVESNETDEFIAADLAPWEPPNSTNELTINQGLDEEYKQKFLNIIAKYSSLFTPLTKYGQVKNFEFTINLKEDYKPFTASPYEKTEIERKLITDQMEEMLKFDVIRKSNAAEFCSPVFTVTKRDGGRRFVVDFRKLNQETVDLRWPIPNVQSILDVLSNNSYFTTLDMKSGYWQVPMSEKDKAKTAFVTHMGTYEFNVLPFGLKCAPAFFQNMVDSILDSLRWNICVVYLDDIIITGKTIDEHLENCDKVLKRLDEAQLKINLNKSKFGFNEIEYLGYCVSIEGTSPVKKNIEPIALFPTPATVKEVKSFLGMVNFYRDFIPSFASLTDPLNNLTRKNVPFEWTQDCEQSFQKVKELITSAPVLAFFDDSKEIRIYTDACKKGIGGILNQVHDGKERLVICVSRSTTRPEKNYSITELEGLAIVWTLTKLRQYLIGREFILFTDHHALCFILNGQPMQPKSKTLRYNDRMIRWLLRLPDFKFTVVHKPGTSLQHADCISRFPQPIEAQNEPDELPIFLNITWEPWDKTWPKIQIMQEEDSELKELQKQHPDKFCKKQGLIYNIEKEKDTSPRLFIPKELRIRIIEYLHDDSGHFGITRTTKNIVDRFYWPGMNEQIKQYIKSCQICQRHSYKKYKKNYPITPICNQVGDFFELVGVDAVGPLPMTVNGNKYILVMIDYFTKWAEAKAVRNLTAITTIKFYDEVFHRLGFPKRILSDNGSNFVAEETKKYLDDHAIIHSKATPYHPETNGLCERFNKTLKHVLTKALDGKTKGKWDRYLCGATWYYNTSVHDTISNTPYFMVFKREPTLKVDRMFNLKKKSEAKNLKKWLTSLKEVKKKLSNKATKMSNAFKSKTKTFAKGDLIKWKPRGQMRQAFEAKWQGPYKIKEVISPTTYIIEDKESSSRGCRHKQVHINDLEEFSPRGVQEDTGRHRGKSPVRDLEQVSTETYPGLRNVSTNDEEDEEEGTLEVRESVSQIPHDLFGHESPESDSSDDEEGETIIRQLGQNFYSQSDTPDEKARMLKILELINASSSTDGEPSPTGVGIKSVLREKRKLMDRLTQLRNFESLKKAFDPNSSTQFDEQPTISSIDQTLDHELITPTRLRMNKDFYTITTTSGMSKTPIAGILKTPKGAMASTPEATNQPVRFSTASTRTFSIIPQASSSLLSPSEDIKEIESEEERSMEDKKEKSSGGQYFEVEKILKHREMKTDEDETIFEYFIKWKGYSAKENKWVKEKDMNCDRLLAEYHSRIEKQEKRKQERENRVKMRQLKRKS